MTAANEKFSLRNVIGESMTALGRMAENVVLVNADLMGTCRNRSFAETFPNRAFNVGIAEQNMVSFAAGLAREGFLPYAFSMAPFMSMRAYEQCRTDVAYNQLKVRLIATYAGVSGGISGATHWGIEDCAAMCAIPSMTVIEPCDPTQAKRIMEASLTYPGPLYLRSSVEPVPAIYSKESAFTIGKASCPRQGGDGAFICSGITVPYAIEASDAILRQTGKRIRVVDMHTLKPLDTEAVIDAAATGSIVVAHDHNLCGGLGSLVAGVIAAEKLRVDWINLGIPDRFSVMAHADFLYHQYGMDAEGLTHAMLKLIKEK